MTEEDARNWIADRWGTGATDRLQYFAELLISEMSHQNLIAASTLPSLWVRHFLDSAQLVSLVGDDIGEGDWVDIGSGAGFPGVVVAILQQKPVRLIEPRRRRVEFLRSVIETLKLDASVFLERAQTYNGPEAVVVTARAVASLSDLFASAQQFTTRKTLWLLPKGKSARNELAGARLSWQGMFHVEQSLTATDSSIVVARGVKPL